MRARDFVLACVAIAGVGLVVGVAGRRAELAEPATPTRSVRYVSFGPVEPTRPTEQVVPYNEQLLRGLSDGTAKRWAAWVEVAAVGESEEPTRLNVKDDYGTRFRAVRLTVIDGVGGLTANEFVVPAFSQDWLSGEGWHMGRAVIGQEGLMVIEDLERWPAELDFVHGVTRLAHSVERACAGYVEAWYPLLDPGRVEPVIGGGIIERKVLAQIVESYFGGDEHDC